MVFFSAIRLILNYTFRLFVLICFDSENAHLHRCFRNWTFLWVLDWTSNSSVSCLDPPLGYSTGEFQALQLIFVVLCGAVDEPLASCILVHFLAIKFEMRVGLLICHNAEQLFQCFWLHFTYLLMPHNKIILNIRLLYFHVLNSALFLHSAPVL